MTRFIYDNFTKQYLEELLSELGKVEPSKKIISERLEIDVFFTLSPEKKEHLSELGLLGKMLTNVTLIEAYHNPVTKEEIMGCMGKLCLVCDEIFRAEKKEGKSKIKWEELPFLWIITPTASRQILNFFRVMNEPLKWGEGVYIFSEGLRLGIVVVHQLPKTEETLWLRLLGRGKVAKQAMLELKALPEDNEFKSNTLELVYSLLAILQLRQDKKQQIQTEEKELIMRLSPEYLTAIETATQKGVNMGLEQGLTLGIQQGLNMGVQQGIQQGVQQGIQQISNERRMMIENFLLFRFGEIDQQLNAIITPLSEMPPSESTRLLRELNREQLIARFTSDN